MEWKKNITDTLKMISEGVDPLTGEVVDIKELKQDPAFQSALRDLVRACGNSRSGSKYAQMEAAHPEYAVIMAEGYFFAAHNKSAFVLNRVLGYRLGLDFYRRPTTGGPVFEKIAGAFQQEGLAYILVRNGEVAEQVEGENPFIKYQIDDDVCKRFISEEMSGYSAETGEPPMPLQKAEKNTEGYPYNLLKELLPDGTEYPTDIEKRLAEVLSSETVFTQVYRRDADCVREYYENERTLEEIGTEYGISRERIRQIIKRALQKLRRKTVLSYLTGDSDTLCFSKRETAKIPITERGEPSLNQMRPTTQGSISISEFARRLSVQATGGVRLRYADITSWLLAVGDLIRVEEASGSVTIPTSQGIEHGIKRGKRTNSAGKEYVGIYLVPNGQEYLTENLQKILAMIDE